jgi:hypothetical protein
MKTTLVIAGILCMAAVAQPASAKDVEGRYGYLGEWSVDATLQETSRTWYGSREWSGPARVRHTGLCAVEENGDQLGEMVVRTTPVGRTVARLTVGSTDCVFAGSLQSGEQGFATCNGTAQVPMTLRER